MQITFSHDVKHAYAIIFLISKNGEMPHFLEKYNINGELDGAIGTIGSFEGNDRQVMYTHANGKILILVGIGDPCTFSRLAANKLGAKISDQMNELKIASASLVVDNINGCSLSDSDIALELATGMKLRNYSFNKYFVSKRDKHMLYLNHIELVLKNHHEARAAFIEVEPILDSTLVTRDLISEPANILTPEAFMLRCKELEHLGVKVTVLNKERMAEHSMGMLLGVAQGSNNDPYTVILEWDGTMVGEYDELDSTKTPTIAIVGKGVCFDTGGINIKSTASNIADMKYDMGGAAVVFGVIRAMALRKAGVRVIGALGLVENMPSGKAQRPSDVVVSMSGQTVEVENTDAEGRLVLGDVIYYVEKYYEPNTLIDVATLTGAVVMALGEGGYAGLFANNDEIAAQFYKIGNELGEYVWRLPMSDFFDRQINSEIADIRNTGTGRGAGASTAAHFIKRFVRPETKWVHLDIAGMTWSKSGTALSTKGATGFGVRLISNWLLEYAK